MGGGRHYLTMAILTMAIYLLWQAEGTLLLEVLRPSGGAAGGAAGADSPPVFMGSPVGVGVELGSVPPFVGAGGCGAAGCGAASCGAGAARDGAPPRRKAGSVYPLEVPAQYRCPISQELMEDPVATSDGHTYERREIFRWLCTHNTSPLTGATLPNKALTPAIALRQLIAAFVADNPALT